MNQVAKCAKSGSRRWRSISVCGRYPVCNLHGPVLNIWLLLLRRWIFVCTRWRPSCSPAEHKRRAARKENHPPAPRIFRVFSFFFFFADFREIRFNALYWPLAWTVDMRNKCFGWFFGKSINAICWRKTSKLVKKLF